QGIALRTAEGSAMSMAQHHQLFDGIACDAQVLAILRENFTPRRLPVEISDRSDLIFRRNASRLNKLLLRYMMQMRAVVQRRFADIRVPSVAKRGERALDSAISSRYGRVVVRFGPEGAIRGVCRDVKLQEADETGYRLGSERFFPHGYFERPKELVRKKI